MSKQIEFNVEYSPDHELAAEKAVKKAAGFEMTSESIRTLQNVCERVYSILFIQKIIFERFLSTKTISIFLPQWIILIHIIRQSISVEEIIIVEFIQIS